MVKTFDRNQNDVVQTNLIDAYVGSRIRLCRVSACVSQEQLGRALGITFQQIQKYENGANRVGASRLFEISRCLGVPITYFFDEMPPAVSDAPLSGPRRQGIGVSEQLGALHVKGDAQLNARETLDLVRLYYGIPNGAKRKLLFEFMNFLASSSAG
jgi:transcriptional regulator with XRE-family HTH domain